MSGKDKDKQEKQSTTERLVKGESHSLCINSNKTPVASGVTLQGARTVSSLSDYTE